MLLVKVYEERPTCQSALTGCPLSPDHLILCGEPLEHLVQLIRFPGGRVQERADIEGPWRRCAARASVRGAGIDLNLLIRVVALPRLQPAPGIGHQRRPVESHPPQPLQCLGQDRGAGRGRRAASASSRACWKPCGSPPSAASPRTASAFSCSASARFLLASRASSRALCSTRRRASAAIPGPVISTDPPESGEGVSAEADRANNSAAVRADARMVFVTKSVFLQQSSLRRMGRAKRNPS